MSFYKFIKKNSVNQKKKSIIIIFLFLSIAFLAESSKSLICEIIYFQTDKDSYYAEESIQLEVSWTFDFVEEDNPFFQIRIFDNYDSLIWNSSEFREKGLIEKNWTIIIENLDLNFNNNSNTISIKAIVFNEINGGPMTPLILQTKFITINKRNLCCELSNFPDKVILGNNLSLEAQFYVEETNVSLSGEDIHIKILSNNSKMFEINSTLNNHGLITLNLSSLNDMALGINILIFNISNLVIYNQTTFTFEILVEKASVFVDILKYEEKLGWSENLELELFFYCFDEFIKPLKNKTVKILIYDNYNMNHQFYLHTDDSGFLKINLSTSTLDIDYINTVFFLDLIFNGSEFLKEKKLILKFEILTAELSNNYSFISFIIISVIIFLSVLVLSNYIYQMKKRKPKFKKINEICFKF